jgi:hypothetical protein
LHFFSRDGNEPKGGGLGVQVEILDGIGGRFSWFPFKRGTYLTGWADPYRVYNKIQELRAEFGIYEIPWDPYVPKAVPAAVEVPSPVAVAPQKTKASPTPALSPKKCASKVKKEKKAKKKYGKLKKRVIKKAVRGEEKPAPPPCDPPSQKDKLEKPPAPSGEPPVECRQSHNQPKKVM